MIADCRDTRSLEERHDLTNHGLAPHLQRSQTPLPSWAPRDRLRQIQGGLPDGKLLPDSIWLGRHRAILLLLWLHVPAITLFAVVTGGYGLRTQSLGEAALVAILAASATLAGRKTRNRRILSTIVALGLLTSSVTIVHLSGGADEAHFHFFVVLCVLLLYEDWLPYATAFAYVVLDHGTIGVINSQSGGIAHPWRWAAIHVLCITIVSSRASRTGE